METLRTLVGDLVLDHVALAVQPGRMITAVALFVEQFGWTEDEGAAVSGDWGKARFVCPPGGGVRLQLSEPADLEYGVRLPNVHPAFRVFDPIAAARAMVAWCHRGGIEGTREELPGGKWFVYLPDIFAVAIELVPAGWDYWEPLMTMAVNEDQPLVIAIPKAEYERLRACLEEQFPRLYESLVLAADPGDSGGYYVRVR